MNWKDAKDKIVKEARAIEFTPPDEVIRLFKHQIIPSGQGNTGQAFTTMVFVEGDSRALAYYNVLCMVRLVSEPSFTLEHMKILYREYIPLSTLFQSTCGLEKVNELAVDILNVLDTLETKMEFKELLDSFCVYVSILHTWVHNFFPWYIGELFPQRTPEDIKEIVRMGA